jgi:hypothetical protein
MEGIPFSLSVERLFYLITYLHGPLSKSIPALPLSKVSRAVDGPTAKFPFVM